MSAKNELLSVLSDASSVLSDYIYDLRDRDEDGMYERRIKSLEDLDSQLLRLRICLERDIYSVTEHRAKK